MMDSKSKSRYIKIVDVAILFYLFLWALFLNFQKSFGKFLPIDVKEFVSRSPFWLAFVIYAIFSACLYSFTFLRPRLSFKAHMALAWLIIISSTFVFASVFTRFVVLFVIFMLTLLIIILSRKRKTSD
jgi:hypothetical protein